MLLPDSKMKYEVHNLRLRCTYILNFMNIHPAVLEIPCSQDFFTKKQTSIKSTILKLEKKTKNILAILFLHIAHVKF